MGAHLFDAQHFEDASGPQLCMGSKKGRFQHCLVSDVNLTVQFRMDSYESVITKTSYSALKPHFSDRLLEEGLIERELDIPSLFAEGTREI